ncbi:hypothetical protein HZH66_004276 [Vespula vulgaris]|uniref:Uncharacterized protein n=1 Tax=Vespula vulgaris TaxID=7454 RepID=A0A834KEY5_VESVU|nr:hypothetical protein HZH66_004276 [Vespula vulgaris]
MDQRKNVLERMTPKEEPVGCREPVEKDPLSYSCVFMVMTTLDRDVTSTEIKEDVSASLPRRRFSPAFAGTTTTSQNDEEPYARPSSEVAGPPFAFCTIGNGLWIFAWPTATMPGDSYSRIKLKTSGEHAESYFCSARGNRTNECRDFATTRIPSFDGPARLEHFTVCLRRSEVWRHHGRWDGRGDVCAKQEVGEAATTKR